MSCRLSTYWLSNVQYVRRTSRDWRGANERAWQDGKVSLGENRGSFSFNAPWNDGTKCGQTQIRLHGGWLLKAGVCAMTLVQHESRNVWIMMLKPSFTRLLFTVYWLPVLPWGLRDSNVLFESRSGMVWYRQADQPRSKPCEPWNQVIPGEPKSGKNK